MFEYEKAWVDSTDNVCFSRPTDQTLSINNKEAAGMVVEEGNGPV